MVKVGFDGRSDKFKTSKNEGMHQLLLKKHGRSEQCLILYFVVVSSLNMMF